MKRPRDITQTREDLAGSEKPINKRRMVNEDCDKPRKFYEKKWRRNVPKWRGTEPGAGKESPGKISVFDS